MKADIKVPAMGESISSATVGAILKPTGSQVAADEEILELETDKVNQVLYAPQAGVITLTVAPHEVVKIGQVIGYVESAGAPKEPELPAPQIPPITPSPAQPSVQPSAQPPAQPPKQPSERPPVQSRAQPGAQPPEQQSKQPPQKPSAQPPAQPSVQPVLTPPATSKKTTEAGVRYTKEAFVAEVQAQIHVQTPLLRETRRKMSKVRRVIAERLVQVQNSTASLTTFNEVDMSQVLLLREKYKELFAKTYGVRLGFMSFFVKAAVSALEAFPDFNSYIDGDEIVHREYYDIGVAVGTEKGVFVPVVRNCDRLTYHEIEAVIADSAAKAKEGTLTLEDLQGGGFTITNGGVYGSLLSTPILNPPQSAILGMHKIEKRPIVVDDQIIIRPMMYLALTYDHRVVDGKEAVTFLVHVKNMLEDPTRQVLHV